MGHNIFHFLSAEDGIFRLEHIDDTIPADFK